MPELSPELEELAAELEGLALLGSGADRARQLLARLAAEAGARPNLARRLEARSAELAAATQELDAPERLEEAALAWDGPRALSLSLRAVRSRLQIQDRGRAEAAFAALEEPPDAAEEHHTASRGEWALTRALLGGFDEREHLEEALEHLPSPGSDADRLVAHLRLADHLHSGGDPNRARHQLSAALELAHRYDDGAAVVLVSALLGNLHLEQGRLEAARPTLEECVDRAEARGDTLTMVAEGTVLVALLMRLEDWESVEGLAGRLAGAAWRRGNWLAVADATMAGATAALAKGRLPAAIDAMVATYTRLEGVGAMAALQILRARLAELRIDLGAEAFDPAMQAVLQVRMGQRQTEE